MKQLFGSAIRCGWDVSWYRRLGGYGLSTLFMFRGMSWPERFVYACGYTAAFLWFYREYVGLITTAVGSTFLTLTVVFGWWPF